MVRGRGSAGVRATLRSIKGWAEEEAEADPGNRWLSPFPPPVRCDPIAFLQTFQEHIRHIHLKDWREEPGGGRFVELGRGNVGIDFAAVQHQLGRSGYRGWVVVETDKPTGSAAASAAASFEHLAGCTRVHTAA